MIRVTVELISAISRDRDRLLGVAEITNEGTSQYPCRYTYHVWLSKWAPKERQAWREGKVVFADNEIMERLEGDVENFDRQKRGAWDLIYLALRRIVGDRNP